MATCKPGAVLGLGRAGFMTTALSLLCTILLLLSALGAPPCQLFPLGALSAPSTLTIRGGCCCLDLFTVMSVRAELKGPFRRASESHSQKITEQLWLQVDVIINHLDL